MPPECVVCLCSTVGPPIGKHKFTLRAYDESGDQICSDSTYIWVEDCSDVTGPSIGDPTESADPIYKKDDCPEPTTVTITSEITDYPSGVKRADLWYRLNKGNWHKLEMDHTGDSYYATIGPFSEAGTVEYNIKAYDNRDNKSSRGYAEWTVTVQDCITAGAIAGIVGEVIGERFHPLGGARVSLETGESTTTASDGTYQMNVPPGLHTVTASKAGYHSQVTPNVIVASNATLQLRHILVSESCLPTDVACSINLVGILPALFEVPLGDAGVWGTVIGLWNEACNVRLRWERGDPLAAFRSVLKIVSTIATKLADVLVPGLGALADAIRSILSCVEGILYDFVRQKCGSETQCVIAIGKAIARLLQEMGRLIVLVHTRASQIDGETGLAMANVVELHIYNEAGNHLGLRDGQIEYTIPNSYLFTLGSEYQIAVIGDARAQYQIRIEGRGATNYETVVIHPKRDGTLTEVSHENLSAEAGSLASITINQDSDDYNLRLDDNGDGVVDRTALPEEIIRRDFNIPGPTGLTARASDRAISLRWNASPRPGLVGYRIYYGTSSEFYDAIVDAGNTTNYRLEGLDNYKTYYIAIVSYDTLGVESGYSEEVSAKPGLQHVYLPLIVKSYP